MSLFSTLATISSVRRRWVLVVLEDNDIDKMLAALDGSVSIDINGISCGLWDQDIPIVIIMRGLEDIDRFLSSS